MHGAVGVDAGFAVLHRVSMETAGEVDSVSVTPDGVFEFVIPQSLSVGVEAEILFASVRYDGVLYFGSAVTEAEQLDSLYVVNVFPAQEAPPEGGALPVNVRNIFLEQSGEGWRVTDLFQILNEGDRTLVAADDGVVWTYPLPPEATSAELGQGDLPPDAVTFEDGRVSVRAPLPPGERMLLIRYELPAIDVEFPVPGVTETLELLVREPAPALDVLGLQPIDVVALDAGSAYRRYAGTGLRDVVVLVEEQPEGRLLSMGLFAALVAALLGGVGLFAYIRPRESVTASAAATVSGAAPTMASPPNEGRDRLILRAARIDESLDTATDPATRRMMMEERAALLAQLRARS